MKTLGKRQVAIIVALAFIGWILCGAIMWIGMAITSLETTLILHAIGAPIIFAAVSWFYFKKFNFTTALQTAMAFVSIVIFVDFFLVALLINGSLEMFASPIGTWIPFVLIFISTYLTGRIVISSSAGN